MIHLQHIYKRFNGKALFEDLNLSIECGDFLSIVGASGSGKTTLLRLMNGLEKPDEGNISTGGELISDKTEKQLAFIRRKIGYVMQRDGLFPHLSIKENISYTAKLIKMSPALIEERIAALVSILQIEKEWLPRYPNELSGGQRQRVGIARALCANAKILLMDEPFGALDEITRKALQEAIINIWETQRITIVLVTHDINEALKVSNKLLILHQGKIVFFGTTDSIKTGKAIIDNPFAQALLN